MACFKSWRQENTVSLRNQEKVTEAGGPPTEKTDTQQGGRGRREPYHVRIIYWALCECNRRLLRNLKQKNTWFLVYISKDRSGFYVEMN